MTIGSQVWLAEDLKTHHLNDGINIQYVTDAYLWSTLSSSGCCYFNNYLVNKDKFVILYNWYAVGTGKLCPTGWHVATEEDWSELVSFLGGESVAGPKLMEPGYWNCYYTGCVGTNESGFSARGGKRRTDAGVFFKPDLNYIMGLCAYWWCDTDVSSLYGTAVSLNGDGEMDKYSSLKKYGYSVRCVMDR